MLTDLPLLRRGKVRDVHDLGDRVLLVASDRISAFDVVLPTEIPGKGVALTQLSRFWFDATRHLMPNHLLDDAVPEQFRGRAMIGRKAQRIDVECLARGYLTGSVWADAKRRGTTLVENQELPEPIFTSAAKVDSGHDQPMTFQEVESAVGREMAARLRDATLAIYAWARAFARERGIIIADTKLEFGTVDGELIVIDELLTPDSSRFWPLDEYTPGGPQPSFDKQYVRDYLETLDWNKQPPGPALPPEVVEGTAARYREVYRRLVGREL